MTNKGKAGLIMLGALIIFVAFLWTFGYWFVNDELTRMQMFKKFWWLYIGGGVYLVFAKYYIENLKKKRNK